MSERKCGKCDTVKPLADFRKAWPYCRPCEAARFKAFYEKNKAEQQAKSLARRNANLDRARASLTAWKEQNREHAVEYARQRRRDDPAASKALGDAYRAAYPERKRAGSAVSKAVKDDATDMRLAVTWLCTAHHKQLHAAHNP